MINKTDRLDARGLNRLQRNGTLPTVWIPPAELRDKRDLPRTRMVLSRERTRLKNRVHATLAKYALEVQGLSDIFGKAGLKLIWASVEGANAVCLQRRFFSNWHTSQLYDRIAHRKGQQKAVGAVARHLAEATYWMLKRKQSYQEPKRTVPVSSTEA
ncbi:MAG: transposase [Deltaproteobacteria bacterium]|nr:transposase [Deltaproteobacteria bacterium]